MKAASQFWPDCCSCCGAMQKVTSLDSKQARRPRNRKSSGCCCGQGIRQPWRRCCGRFGWVVAGTPLLGVGAGEARGGSSAETSQRQNLTMYSGTGEGYSSVCPPVQVQ